MVRTLADNLRYAAEDSDGLRYFTWDRNGMNLLMERDAYGTVVAQYSHGFASVEGSESLQAAKKIVDGVAYYQYPHYDLTGNVMRVTDSGGAVTHSYERNAWGEEISATEGDVANRFGYNSNWIRLKDGPFDLSETRILYPEIGRFLSRDPANGREGSYTYCANQPVSRADAAGMCGESKAEKKVSPKPKPKVKDAVSAIFRAAARAREMYRENREEYRRGMPPEVADRWDNFAASGASWIWVLSEERGSWRKEDSPSNLRLKADRYLPNITPDGIPFVFEARALTAERVRAKLRELEELWQKRPKTELEKEVAALRALRDASAGMHGNVHAENQRAMLQHMLHARESGASWTETAYMTIGGLLYTQVWSRIPFVSSLEKTVTGEQINMATYQMEEISTAGRVGYGVLAAVELALFYFAMRGAGGGSRVGGRQLGRSAIRPEDAGRFTPRWRYEPYGGRLGRLLARMGVKKPVLDQAKIELLKPGSAIHELQHWGFAERFPHLAQLQQSRIPVARFFGGGTSAWIDEALAYGTSNAARFAPLRAFSSMSAFETAGFASTLVTGVAAGGYGAYGILHKDRPDRKRYSSWQPSSMKPGHPQVGHSSYGDAQVRDIAEQIVALLRRHDPLFHAKGHR